MQPLWRIGLGEDGKFLTTDASQKVGRMNPIPQASGNPAMYSSPTA